MALTTSLISYYKLDDDAASTHVDDAVGNNDGTAVANTSTMYEASGKINSCLDFNGTTDGISTGIGNLNDTLSVNFWIKRVDTPTNQEFIVAKWQGTGDNKNRFAISYQSDTTLYAYIGDTGGWQSIEANVNTSWHMLTMVIRPTGYDVYFDGSISITNYTSTYENINSKILFIGEDGSNNVPYDGLIDEVGIWNKALTSTEITALYNSGDGFAYPFAVNKTVEPATQTLSLSGETSVAVVLDNPLSLSSSLTGLAPVPVLTVLPSTLELTSVGNVPPILQEPDTLILKLIFQTPSLNILNNTWRNPNYGTKSTKIISNLDIPDGIGGVMNLLPETSHVLSKKRVGLGML